MTKNPSRIVVAVFFCAIGGGNALAQSFPAAPGLDLSIGPGPYNVKSIDFDLWCQQTQRYAIERCTARRPEDVKAFEDYRSSVERYELDYLKQVQKDQDALSHFNRDPLQTVRGKQDGVP
jgi:hypothetical protein